jgi:hypothetical protein
MRIRTFLIPNAIVSLFFGLVLLLIPAQVLGFYGSALSPSAVTLARLVGTGTLTIALVAWLAREADRSNPVFVALSTAIAVGHALSTVIAAHAVLTGAVNGYGWTAVAVYAGLTAGWGYFAFMRPAPIAARFT